MHTSAIVMIYSMLYVVGNEQARCTVLYYINVYALYRKAVQLCHGCATAHSMNLQYVATMDFYKPGYTMHSIATIATI